MELSDRLRLAHLTAHESKFNRVLSPTWGQCVLCCSHGSTSQKEVAIAVTTETNYGTWSRFRHLCYECAIEINNSELLSLPQPSKPQSEDEDTEIAMKILQVTGGGVVAEIKRKAIALGYEINFPLFSTLNNMVEMDEYGAQVSKLSVGRLHSFHAIAEVLENAS